MSKRFSDTEIWKKKWYCDLSPAMKCFWKYICDNCDNAGVWEMNIPLAEYQIGCKLSENDILTEFNGNVIKIAENKMFVADFISFQYGEIKEDNIPHRNVFKLLNKHGIRYPIDRVLETSNTLLDKDKDKDKEKDKEKDTEKKEENRKEELQIPDHLKEVFPAFLEVRAAKKAVNSARAIKMIITELNKLSQDNDTQIKIIEQSIRSSWKDVYPIKNSNQIMTATELNKQHPYQEL